MSAYPVTYEWELTETYPPFSNDDPTLRRVDGPAAVDAAPGGFAPPVLGASPRHPGGLEG